ncbi:hypothetical protein [Acetivibrio straminisolvens]|uniref:hypothetical protein n=1 Tax=Acetivibrio straminisolvens TaxID=253314 RepID=UPI00223F27A8|nr:hypothetical protein [Acetivibrio straminisolvens]
MHIHDLLILLQHEVLKSLTFIDKTRGAKEPGVSAVHIFLKSVETELSVAMSYTLANAKKEVSGKGIGVQIVCPIEKIDEKTQKEYIGRIKVVFKPILKFR